MRKTFAAISILLALSVSVFVTSVSCNDGTRTVSVTPASATPAPASATPAPASATPAPASATPVPASATPVPASATPAPASATPVPASATPVSVDPATIDTKVFITATGTKYHRSGCRYLKDSKRSIGVDDANKQGYEPCSVCHP